MRSAGVRVGLGVDGSASNDSSHMLAEARMAMLLARIKLGQEMLHDSKADRPEAWMTAREALEMGTRGGAAVLGRDDIGSLEPGKCADFIAINLNRVGYAGAIHDPVAAVVFCAPRDVDYTVVHGKFVVKEGQLITLDLPPLIEKQNALARAMRAGG
jgi:cytosine/adenosine deaminase-related metal-dependent hydrolase